MPDEEAQNEESPQMTGAQGEAQTLAQADGNDVAKEGALSLRRYAALAAGSFLISALAALIIGGHFRRRPLAAVRHVPLVGRLIPAPPKPPEKKPEDVPTVAELHPMPATEISELIQNLQDARDGYAERRQDLDGQEERLRALQLDLQRERDLLDQLMATLAKRQAEVQAERQALDAEAILATTEERKRLTKLARIYEAQTPESAATELEVLDQSAKSGLAAKILAQMQEKKAAGIFAEMTPEAALSLKEKISQIRYQQDQATEEATP